MQRYVHPSPAHVAVLLLASTLPFMQAAMLAPALAEVARTFQDDTNSAFLSRLILIAPAVALVFSAWYVGWLVDRAQRRKVLLVGLAFFAVCGVLSFLAVTPAQIIGARILLGGALGVILTVATALIGDYFSGAEREKVLGWQGAVYGLTTAIGPVIGGAIALVDWPLIFLVNLIALPMMMVLAGLPPVQVASRAGDQLHLSPRLLVIFFVAFCGFLFLYLVTLQISFHLAEIGQGGALAAGMAVGAPAVTATACSMRYGRLRGRWSYPAMGGLAFLLIALGYGLVAVAATVPAALAGLLLAGCGFGLHVPNCSAWLLSNVAANVRGRALGGLATAMFCGQLISPFIYEPLVNGLGSSGTFASAAGASAVMWVLLAAVARREVVTGQRNS